MKEKITLGGRSLVFNVVFVVTNLIGLAFLVLGYHESAGENAIMYKSLGLILMMLSIGGLILFKGKLMMSNVSRVLVGGLFIVSGLVKANDPIGFSYKLEEYFEDGALAYRVKELFGAPSFSLEFLMDHALLLSILICIAEIVLGVLVIIGGKIKLTSYFMVSMMIFFTFLTWHTSTCDTDATFLDHDTYSLSDTAEASQAKTKLKECSAMAKQEKEAKKNKKKFDKNMWVVSKSSDEVVIAEMKPTQCVNDCGCFGDALKGSVGRSLTPDESLWKDIVLLYLTVWIFLAQWITKPNTRYQNMLMIPTSMLVVGFFSWVFGWYFPIWFALVGLLGALWVLRVGKRYLGNHYGSAIFVTVMCLVVITYVLMYSPIKDYRPYAVGSNLIDKMNDGVDGEYANVFVYKNKSTGKIKELTEKEYMALNIWEDKNWVFKDRIQKTIVPMKNPSIMDFNPTVHYSELSDDERNFKLVQEILDTSWVSTVKYYDIANEVEGEIPLSEFDTTNFPAKEYQVLDTITAMNDVADIEIKDGILKEKRIVIMVSQNLIEADWSSIGAIKAIKKACDKKGVPFIFICNATREDINAFKKKHSFSVPTFTMDEIELKIISRSNPALLVLEKAVVKGKYPHRSIPTVETFNKNHLK